MIQKVFILLLLSLQISAIEYNATLLEIEAKLFPKMMLLNEDLDKNTPLLKVAIISREIDYPTAQILKQEIEQNYPDTIMGKKISITITPFRAFSKRPDALIVLYHTHDRLKSIAAWANSQKVMTFAYESSYMDAGILASLYIGKTTKPYLNKEIIKEYNFTFNPYLLELSKFR